MDNQIIYQLNSRDLPERIGNKAKNLHSLMDIRKIKVPKTYVIPWDVFQHDQNNQELVSEQLASAIKTGLDLSKSYAVRSSSNIEDASFHSFAGLFKTNLFVQGEENLRDAIFEVWNSAHADHVSNYLEKLSIAPEKIKMAVMIQEMINPQYSGVLFSRNPMTGTSEMVLEAVVGEGTSLVQAGVTPERWISRGGAWVAKPDEGQMPSEVAKTILEKAQKILGKVSKPIDLEWVYDGLDVYWVQMREITILKDLRIYSNRISKEMMPGMIHPLIWSINVPLINTVWLSLLEELVGKLPITADELAKSFFYRSYFNMGAIGQVFNLVGFPSEGLEMMMGVVPGQTGRPMFKPNPKMLRLLPRIGRFFYDKWNFEKKIHADLPKVKRALNQFSATPDPNQPIEKQIKEIHDLYHTLQKLIYLNIVTPLLVSMYVRMLEKQLHHFDINLLQFDLMENLGEFDENNPSNAIKTLNEKYGALLQTADIRKLLSNQAPAEVSVQVSNFKEDLDQFLQKFGHFSDNINNFTAVPWRENPEGVVNMIRDYQEISREKETRIGLRDLPLKGIRKTLTQLLYRRARNFTLFRDQISNAYIYGYGLFRPYFFRLANSLVMLDWLETQEDIFYLTWDEIQHATLNKDGSTLRNMVTTRKEEMEACQDVILPEVIYGDEAPPVFAKSYQRLQGTPTSQGYYTGPVKIVSGSEDFGKVEPGDVIVIPYSDVAWVPLFARAGAVIAESGGMLSHSSIIAREYQIPAIVSVANCMQLKDFQKVSVNGFTGEIDLIEGFAEPQFSGEADDSTERIQPS